MATAAPRLLYSSFDVFPSPKGAAVHIDAIVRAIGRNYGSVELVTLARDAPLPSARPWLDRPSTTTYAPGVRHTGLRVHGPNLIARAMDFRRQIRRFWGDQTADLVHFRSIFEGQPFFSSPGLKARRSIFEVNGLPSIELKYHHPDVADDDGLIQKLRRQEDHCLRHATHIVTPSSVTRELVLARGVAESEVTVIPNGVNEAVFTYASPTPMTLPLRLLYAGTVTSWQGLKYALEALRLLRRDLHATLTIVGPIRRRQRTHLNGLIAQLGLEGATRIQPPVPQNELAALYHHHHMALAPLTACDRNLLQGCCPLKVLEAMAAGTPLVASDLPVVRALASQREAVLVRPNSAKAIKDGILALWRSPELGPKLSAAARVRIDAGGYWSDANATLLALYDRLLDGAP